MTSAANDNETEFEGFFREITQSPELAINFAERILSTARFAMDRSASGPSNYAEHFGWLMEWIWDVWEARDVRLHPEHYEAGEK